MSSRRLLLVVAMVSISFVSSFATGPSFIPDGTLKGSSLAGWHTVGPANWHVENGVLTGTPGPSGAGGWLVLDHSYQDVGVFTRFQCTGSCETGILFRAEKTPDGGMKGSYASLNSDTVTYFDVTVDALGKITSRTPLPRGGGQQRIAPPPNPNEPERPHRSPGGFNPYLPSQGVTYPFMPPDTKIVADKWNQVELMFDANILRATQNNGDQSGSVANADGYGPIAFYVAGTGEVHFEDVAWKDLMLHAHDADYTSPDFRKQTLNNFYYSWGAAAGDFNHDGVEDIVAGPYIYYGPDYSKSSEVYLAQTSNPSTEYADNAWMEFAGDFENNGWPDVLTCKFGGASGGCFLYVNSQGQSRRWNVHRVVDNLSSEIAVVRKIDGKLAVVYAGDGYVRYAQPDPANPTGLWKVHNVSGRGYGTAHGIGVGDLNGDERMDILNPYGWWENPGPGSSDSAWKFHPMDFGRYGRGQRMGGSVMAVYDVNGDGHDDVVTVLDAHGWGLAWFEQKRDAQGNISFVRHMVMDDFSTKNAGNVTFSEAHGDTFGDINGDGIPDFIVGKRFWSHRDDYLDPDPYGTPVLYWYETVRDPHSTGGARLVPHLIDNRSGAGSDILAVDLKHDGKVDIVTATRFGAFIFWNKMHGAKPESHKSAAAH
jgi:hypothetical protein